MNTITQATQWVASPTNMRAYFVEIPYDVVKREDGEGVEVFIGRQLNLESILRVDVYPDNNLERGLYKAMVIHGSEETNVPLSQAQYEVLSKELELTRKPLYIYNTSTASSPQLPNLPVDLPAVSQLEERYKKRAQYKDCLTQDFHHNPTGFYED